MTQPLEVFRLRVEHRALFVRQEKLAHRLADEVVQELADLSETVLLVLSLVVDDATPMNVNVGAAQLLLVDILGQRPPHYRGATWKYLA